MQKLYFTYGLPASGKTKWAKQMQKRDPAIVRVNKDELRSMLNNGRHTKAQEAIVLRVRNYIVELNLSLGRTVIVDDTNMHPKHERVLRNIASECEVRFIKKDFTKNVSILECIVWDENREKSVGSKVIMDMYNRYLNKGDDKAVVSDEVLLILACLQLVDAADAEREVNEIVEVFEGLFI